MRTTFLTVAPPLPPDVYARRPAATLPFPFHRGRVRVFTRARQGLFQGLRRLDVANDSVALVPAYHHGSEIEAYVRAGLRLRYYEARPDLAPDESELASRYDSSVRILHLIHYLGFAQDAERWRAWCDQRGVLLVEDTAQGWLGASGGRPLGTWGDLSLFSIYKTIGVPDGGAAALRGSLVQPSRTGSLGVRTLMKHVAWIAARSGQVASVLSRVRRLPSYVAEKDFSLGNPARGGALATSVLAPRLLGSEIAVDRARHYNQLLSELRPWVPAPFQRDPEGLSPFAFPVFVRDKARAAALLLQRGIRAVNAWSVPHRTLPVNDFPGAARIRSGVLLLPVHQELRTRDVDRIASEARRALGPPP